MPSPDPLPRAVLFDMDGTLTEPMLDFPLIKREMRIGNRPILEALADMTPTERQQAEEILHRHEDHAAGNSTLNAGCLDVLDWLQRHDVRTALITRNSRRSVRTVLDRHRLPITTLVTREDGPAKPDPAPVLLALRELGASAETSWMVGDGEYDVQAGINAGVRTVWISHDRTKHFPETPWRTCRDLLDLRQLLELVHAGR
jgi:HAD superfamily hydrolase (TIGR01549 family)